MRPALAIALLAIGCSSSSGSLPPGPSPLASSASDQQQAGVAPAPGTELIRGAVHDTALRPLAGALVQVLDGPQAGVSATTDANGNFSLTATVDDSTRFRATREGHVSGTSVLRPYCQACNPHRWLYFFLASVVPTVDLAGDYTLTIIADTACSTLPTELRRRSYTVRIELDANPAYPAGTFFEGRMTGVAFWEDRGGFAIATAGDFITMILGEHGSPYFIEQLAPNAYFAFDGAVRLSIGAPRVSAISTLFQGWVEYWGTAVTPARCESSQHRLVLERR